MARAGSQGRLIDWEEEEEQEEVSPEEVKDGSDSSESFICVSEEVGWEGGPPKEGGSPKVGGPLKEETQDVSEQTKATPIKGSGGGGGKTDSDSDWERWSD